MPPRYYLNDDVTIMRSFMGYEGGSIASFSINIHTVLSWLLFALGSLFAGVPWFSVLQLFFIWLSLVVIGKSFLQLSHCRFRFLGVLLGLACVCVVMLDNMINITYSCTAAICGSAAIAQLFSVDFGDQRHVTLPLIGSAALMFCGYFFREVTFVPIVSFWLLTFFIKLQVSFGAGKRAWREARRFFLLLMSTCVFFILLLGIRAVDIKAEDAGDYSRWHAERTKLFDYTDFIHAYDSIDLHDVGWNDSLKTMVASWYFLDDRITSEAFEVAYNKVTAKKDTSIQSMLLNGWSTLKSMIWDQPRWRAAFLTMCSLAIATLAIAAIHYRKNKGWFAAVPLAFAGSGLLLLYPATQGRLLERVVFVVMVLLMVWIASAFFTLYIPRTQFATSDIRNRWLVRSLAGVCVLSLCSTLLWCWQGFRASAYAPTFPLSLEREEDEVYIDLDEYGYLYDDKLIIYDYSLAFNTMIFPETEPGIPENLLFWGGWQTHAPSWNRMLEQFGITELSPLIFTQDNVLFATRNDVMLLKLYAYLEENIDGQVSFEYYDQYGDIYFYTFSVD